MLAGRTKFLKPGDLLFQTGDAAEGMYIVRRGQVEIYLDNNQAELSLAIMGSGSVIGELSLFDRKPRSASARAVDEVELAVVSVEDFTKVLQLVPKWFVSLTVSICSRLRETNSRLQQSQDRYLIRLNHLSTWIDILNICDLLFYKIGEKHGGGLRMDLHEAENEIDKILGLGLRRIKGLIDAAVESHIFRVESDEDVSYLYIEHKNKLRRLCSYLRGLEKESPDMICDLDLIRHIMHEFLEGHKQGSKIHTPEQIARESHEALAEISQASVNEVNGRNRRQHFRILYKGKEKPIFHSDGHSLTVLDVSEQAIRFEIHSFDEYSPEQILTGTLEFPEKRGSHQVRGKILRCTEHDAVMVFLPEAKIPSHRIMTEQRIMIQKGML